MLIKWENFDAFLSWLLRWEIFLTRDFLNEFYCIQTAVFILHFVLMTGIAFDCVPRDSENKICIHLVFCVQSLIFYQL
jgi:hypothetical protein